MDETNFGLRGVELAAAFEASLRAGRKADGTVVKYMGPVQRFLEHDPTRSPGGYSAGELRRYLEDWYVRAADRLGHAPSAATHRAEVTALRALFRWLELTEQLTDDDGFDTKNRMALIEPPRRVQKPLDRLNADEDKALMAYRGRLHEEVIVCLLRRAGLRVGELIALNVEDLDRSNPVAPRLWVRESKTPNGIRPIPLPPDVLPLLARWQNHLASTAQWAPNRPLIPTRHGGRVRAQWVWRVVKRVCADAGIRKTACTCATETVFGHAPDCPRTVNGEHRSAVTPHTLRRTYATSLLESGLAIEYVSKFLGHSSILITQQAYAQLGDPRAMEEFRKVMGYRTAA